MIHINYNETKRWRQAKSWPPAFFLFLADRWDSVFWIYSYKQKEKLTDM